MSIFSQINTNFFHSIDVWIKHSNGINFIIKIIIISYLFSFPAYILSLLFPGLFISSSGPNFSGDSLIVIFIASCIIAPLIETFVFQWLPIKIIKNFKKASNSHAILISSVAFGLAHTYSLYYVVMTTGVGLVFAYGFVVVDDMGRSAYWYLVAIHSLRNLIAFIFFATLLTGC